MNKPLMRWLPNATAPVVEEARNAAETVDIGQLLRLSHYEWDAAGARRLGRAIRKADGAKLADLVPVKLLMFANGTAEHLGDILTGTGLRHGLLISSLIIEYENPVAFLARERQRVDDFGPDVVVVNYDCHAFSSSTALADKAAAENLVDRSVARIRSIQEMLSAELGKPVILQTISPDPAESRMHVDRVLVGSYKDVVHRTNSGIADLAGATGGLLLDVASLAEDVGLDSWHSARYRAMAKYGFAPDVSPLYAEHLCRLLAVLRGKSKRVLVLDLDNTLWGGIVGDDGVENLALGPGSPVGEAHLAIQLMAKSLRERGVLICLSSKNDEAVALNAIRSHPEMALAETDIAMFQINWQDKAANIEALSKSLNLGLDSFVFVDDNPAERAIVRMAFPQVSVPELPKDVTEWLPVLQSARFFESAGLTAEDKQRAGYYQAESRRAAQLKDFAGHDDYLKSLDMVMDITPFDATGRKRISQLVSKSNQFNLTTIRYSEAEVAQLEADPSMLTAQIRLVDSFGDNGMICVVVARDGEEHLEIAEWLMSCRVLGRRVEEATLDWLVRQAKLRGKAFVTGRFIPTAKNMMVKNHYERLGFSLVDEDSAGATTWVLEVAAYSEYAPPILIKDSISEQR
ncbi:HAD-IIIC family phosphatase [Rhizobium leguminosarum]|nr:HAD-IIIC family phosphatase [Rhizobium leguminosarum]